MLKNILLAGAAVATLAVAGAAQAAEITFNFRTTAANSETNAGNYGNALMYTSGALTLTIKAFGQTGSSSTFQTGYIARYSNAGLGGCNRNEACSDPNHQVDNVGSNDLVQFAFNQNVTIKSITIEGFENDDDYNDLDVSYWLSSNGSQNPNGSNLAGLGTEIESLIGQSQGCSDCDPDSDTRTVTINSANNIQSFLFGALFGSDEDDAFKIRSLVVDYTPPTTVSEPGTLAAFGFGLAGLGFLGRRRKSA